MGYYRINELDFIVPDGWRDSSMNAFVLPAEAAASDAALVITRDLSQPHLDIHEYADRQLVEAAKRFPDYNLVGRRSLLVDGDPAVEISWTWTAPGQMHVQQRQAILKLDGLFLSFTITTKDKDSRLIDDVWNLVIPSIRRRDV